jgi:hypothetical protein
MKRLLHITLPVLIVLLSACSAKKPKDVVFDPDSQGTLPIPSYTRNALDGWPEGRKVDPYDSSRVRHADNVHAYQVGRLPSGDRREMHEAHTVYRVEQSARWDQRLPATPMESSGVILGIREPSNNPVPADQIIANERSRQLALSKQYQDRLDELKQQQKKLDDFLASAPDKSKAIDELQKQRAEATDKISKLEAELTQKNGKLKEYEDKETVEKALRQGSKKP